MRSTRVDAWYPDVLETSPSTILDRRPRRSEFGVGSWQAETVEGYRPTFPMAWSRRCCFSDGFAV